MADSIPIVVICGQVATRRDRHRRLPGSARPLDHGRGREAHFPGDRPDQARGHHPHGLRDRAHRPPRPRRRRRAEGRAELGRRLPGRRHAAHPRLSPPHERAGRPRPRDARDRAVLRDARRGQAAAHLRRRRRDQLQRRRRAARVLLHVRHPGRHHADGHRRRRHRRSRSRCACSACMARRSPTMRSTIAIS